VLSARSFPQIRLAIDARLGIRDSLRHTLLGSLELPPLLMAFACFIAT
jgi:hypothetical protein